MAGTIEKSKIGEFLKRLSGYDIYAPVEERGTILFKKLDDGPERKVRVEFENTAKPPKEVFFPQTEKMFDLVLEGSRIVDVREPEDERKCDILLFGTRPCDARSFTLLDKLFTWDYVDTYYVDKRERGTVISFSCTGLNVPSKNCFCTSVGGGPSSPEGSDMLWTDIGDRFLVESFTEKGQKILKLAGNLFTGATPEQERLAAEAKNAGEKNMGRQIETKGLKEALEASFDSDYWSEFARICLGCGICTLLCPTCHCFDMNDIVSQGKARRERTWDSCQYPYYTAHASGHNPRPDRRHRQRNRIYHKFLYMEKNLGIIGCVGCGRCISNCPVKIDIIEVAEGIKEVAENDI